MSDSLRDQLLGLGFKAAPKPERKPDAKSERTPDAKPATHPVARPVAPRDLARARAQAKSAPMRKPQRATGARSEMDLAKAYAIRAQNEKDERIEAERLKQEQARERREAKVKLAELLKDKALNDPAAEIARHFDYGGKIKRVYVTQAQFKALNAGQIGVIQLDGRYLLVSAELLTQAERIFAPAVALKVDPQAAAADDPYADPQYRVPDELVW